MNHSDIFPVVVKKGTDFYSGWADHSGRVETLDGPFLTNRQAMLDAQNRLFNQRRAELKKANGESK